MQEAKKENRFSLGKKLLPIVFALVLAFSLVGCSGGIGGILGGGSNNNGGGNNGGGGSSASSLSEIKSMLSSVDIPTETVVVGDVGDTLSNRFFDWKVSGVTTADTLTSSSGGSATPVLGGDARFVVVNTTVKNTDDNSIPVGTYDFDIIYEHNGSIVKDVPYSTFRSNMYPEDTTLSVGRTASGDVIFDAPKSVTMVYVCYYELFSNNSTGDTYVIAVDLSSRA